MKRRIAWPMLALLLAGANALAADSEKLGRLFFTPEQRRALDRQAGLMPSGQADELPAEVIIDGEIWRKAERRARWINGRNAPDPAADGPAIPVGDSYHQATGKRASLLGDGRLIVTPGRTSK